jgi:hypothetical protein
MEFRYYQASVRRRLGGPEHLETAAQALRDALAAHPTSEPDPDPESARILSGIQYDLAYIDYLTGRWRAAIDGLERSAATAFEAHDQTRGHISSCVAAVVAFYAAELGADDCRAVLQSALVHFEAAAATSRHAQRWVMNVHAHLFDLAFLRGDLISAE